MHFTLTDIRNTVGDAAFDRGQDYAHAQHVLALNRDGSAINASVRGSGRNIYAQKISLLIDGDEVDIAGRCSCPVGFNCKHVAAALIEFLRRNQAGSATAVGPGSVPVSAPVPDGAPPAQTAIPYAVSAWLQQVESVAAVVRSKPTPEPGADARQETAYRLIFVLAPAPRAGHASLSVCKARLRVDGEIAAVDQLRDLQHALSHPPNYMRAEDEDLLRFFVAMQDGTGYYDPYCEPKGAIGAQLLRTLLDQQKLLWVNSLADLSTGLIHPLKAAPLRRATLTWQEENSRLHLAWQFESGADDSQPSAASSMIDYVLPTDPPWYVDNLSCGHLP